MSTLPGNSRIGLLLLVSLITVAALFFVGPIPQDPRYHLFADSSQTLGLRNFWNIVSNFPFIAVGLFGLSRYSRLTQPESRSGYIVFCVAAVFVGIGSWSWTESLGRGDLRPYLLVQFLPVLLIPLIIFLFPSRYMRNSMLLSSFAQYFIAKLLEHFDTEVLSIIGLTGGHALKHIAAAVAVLCIIYAIPVKQRG
jgi:hypothetical protein